MNKTKTKTKTTTQSNARTSARTDAQARKAALDPTQSLIVQAPAGSGKTSLLVQRYCTLLKHSKKPDALLAITFTRKAADEMRERIQQALPTPDPPISTNPNTNPNRTTEPTEPHPPSAHPPSIPTTTSPTSHLRVMTIDAFCSQLTQTQQHITEHPEPLYIKAVQAFFQQIQSENPWAAPLEKLLRHLDNRYTRLERLLVDLLSKRDQWLPYLIHNTDPKSLKSHLEGTLRHIIQEALYHTDHAFPQPLRPQISALLQQASTHLPSTSSLLPHTHFPTTALTDHPHWCALAEWLLTQSGDWRKSVNSKLGFPAPSTATTPEDKAAYTAHKQHMQALLRTLSSDETLHDLRHHLHHLRQLPALTYAPAQWEVLQALLCLLPALAAQLNLIFQEDNTADFIAVNLAAMEALGPADAPSPLALQLERRIQHILIDEFQDISIAQHRLIEQLIRGWQPDDGHTLFLVGDPMQSIYRFRQAEVGLFQQVQQCGIGGIRPKPLTLKNNFRSCAPLLDWVNRQFSQLCPPLPNTAPPPGAVAYTPCIAATTNASLPTQTAVFCYSAYAFPHAHLHQHRPQQDTETALLDALNTIGDTGSIGILVRARSHLTHIIPILNAHQIPFHGVDLVPLMDKTVIRDLWTLTCALSHLADTTAWLAVLRGPHGRLSVADLACLMDQFQPQAETLWDRLGRWQEYPLSKAGQQQCATVAPVLITAWNTRCTLPLEPWIHTTWEQLGGANTVPTEEAAAAITQFFTLLQQYDAADGPLNTRALEKVLHKTYGTLQPDPLPQIQLLTMHKAKGLEFDHVIIPALERSLPADPHRLLLWSEPLVDAHTRRLLLAPIASSFEGSDPTYQYVRAESTQKNHQEIKRLLYVATTRARKTLHLLAPNAPIDQKPHPNSLLALLCKGGGLKSIDSCT